MSNFSSLLHPENVTGSSNILLFEKSIDLHRVRVPIETGNLSNLLFETFKLTNEKARRPKSSGNSQRPLLLKLAQINKVDSQKYAVVELFDFQMHQISANTSIFQNFLEFLSDYYF